MDENTDMHDDVPSSTEDKSQIVASDKSENTESLTETPNVSITYEAPEEDNSPVTSHDQSETVRIAEFEARRAESERRAAKEQTKAQRYAYKTAKMQDRVSKIQVLAALPKTAWLCIFIIITSAAILILIGIGCNSIRNNDLEPNTIVSSSSLSKLVDIEEIATSEFTYKGIAKLKKEKGGDDCYHIYYEASVSASFDMSKINFDNIDSENKIIYPVLPEVKLKVDVDEDSTTAFERDTHLAAKEYMPACKNDAKKEVEANDQIQNTALDNLKQTVEALTDPLINKEGYTISWDKPADGQFSESSKELQNEQ